MLPGDKTLNSTLSMIAALHLFYSDGIQFGLCFNDYKEQNFIATVVFFI